MTTISISRPDFPILFGGFGFHNSEALFYRLCEKEQFNQKICKCYREIAPGFMRTFGGYANWTKQNMDTFADYYERMQKWTDTPIYFAAAKGQMHFNDEERAQYAENVAANLDYLVNVRGVKQLRYYCYSNELAMNYWGILGKNMPLFQKYHELLYQAFLRHNLNIGLLATDGSDGYWDTLDYAIKNMAAITEDFCLHTYTQEFDTGSLDLYPALFKKFRDTVMKCIQCDGKRFILGELGIRRMIYDANGKRRNDCFVPLPGVIKDTTAFNYEGEGPLGALMYAEATLAAINAGVFAISIWTFCDYPDPYVCHYAEHDPYAKAWGECEQFISQTQDVKYNKCGMIKWEDDGDYSVRESYWCLGLISRYCRRNSKVLDIQCDDPLLRICGLLNKDGSVSVLVINRHDETVPLKLNLNIRHLEKQHDFRVYEFVIDKPPVNEFGDLQEASATLPHLSGAISYEVSPQSLTVFSTDYVERPDIWADNVSRQGNILRWSPVKDDLHCYYRVFRGTSPDFTPTLANQIASTVETELDFSARYLDEAAIMNVTGDFYKVLSINKKR